MKLPVQITYRNLKSSKVMTARIKAEASKLDTFFGRITSCRVVVEAPHRRHKRGQLSHVCIELRVPGVELVVSHDPSQHATLSHDEETALKKRVEVEPAHKDINVAISDAFASARRQLQDYVRRLRGDVKLHPARVGPYASRLAVETSAMG